MPTVASLRWIRRPPIDETVACREIESIHRFASTGCPQVSMGAGTLFAAPRVVRREQIFSRRRGRGQPGKICPTRTTMCESHQSAWDSAGIHVWSHARVRSDLLSVCIFGRLQAVGPRRPARGLKYDLWTTAMCYNAEVPKPSYVNEPFVPRSSSGSVDDELCSVGNSP